VKGKSVSNSLSFAEVMDQNRPQRDRIENSQGGNIGGKYPVQENRNKISWHCKNRKHGQCFMVGCACPTCNHDKIKV
jgi:hypothetical protein